MRYAPKGSSNAIRPVRHPGSVPLGRQTETPADRAILDREGASDGQMLRGVQSLVIAHHKPSSRFDRPSIAPGTHVAAIRMQAADLSEEGRPSPSQVEHLR